MFGKIIGLVGAGVFVGAVIVELTGVLHRKPQVPKPARKQAVESKDSRKDDEAGDEQKA